MRYNQLQEAIIKVPPEILNKVNMYVSSYMYFKIKQYLDRLDMFVSPNMSQEERQKIIQDGKTTMGKLQSQYGAKNISSESAANIVDHTIDMPFDVETFFNELNFKGVNPGLIALLKDRLKLSLLITRNANGVAGSKENSGDYNILITVGVGNLGPRPSFLQNASDIMSTTYHELQHVVQSMAIKYINRNDKQLQRNAGYEDRDSDLEDYYTSGVEFSPQLGNVIDSVVLELEKTALNDELNPNKNEAIKNAIHKVVQDSNETRTFLTHLYRKQPDQYKKAMSNVYKHVSPAYDNFKENGIDYSLTELPPEVLEANVDVMLSVYKMMYKKDQYNVEAYGRTMDAIIEVKVQSQNWTIRLIKSQVRKDGYRVDLHSTDPEFEESENMNAKEVLNLFGILSEITWYDAVDIVDDIEYLTGQRKEVNNESIRDIIQSLNEDASTLDVPFEMTSNNSFNMMGHSYSVEKVPDSADKIDIVQDNGKKTYFVWSLKQMLIAFQMLIRFYNGYSDEVQQILNDENLVMYVEIMSKLRNL